MGSDVVMVVGIVVVMIMRTVLVDNDMECVTSIGTGLDYSLT